MTSSIEQLYSIFKKNPKISTDSRKILPDSIFFALKGANFDGNAYAQKAIEQGALLAVVDNPEVAISERYFLVDDVLATLQTLANYHRRQLQTLIVSITGSNGKTTTKELMRSVLSQTFNVMATKGNLNNHIGVPLTLLSITTDTDIAIVEMGANHPNEIAFLCSIAEPDYGYITNFGKAHLEGFGNVEGVVKAKSELYQYLMSKKKTIIVNSDDAKQVQLTEGYPHIYSFGQKKGGNNTIKLMNDNPVTVQVEGECFVSQLIGNYNFTNIASAIALGRFFNLSYQAIERGITSYLPDNNRSQLLKIGTNTVLLDAYNANPSSMLVAIENMAQMKAERKVLILGDMLELGTFANEEHQAIVDKIASYCWQDVFLIGKNFAQTSSDFSKFEDFGAFQVYFKNNIPNQALILIKGSRGMALERVLKSLFN